MSFGLRQVIERSRVLFKAAELSYVKIASKSLVSSALIGEWQAVDLEVWKLPEHGNKKLGRVIGATSLVMCLGLLAGCNDPGPPADSIFLQTGTDGTKSLFIVACMPITSVEFSEGDNLVAKSQVKYQVDHKDPISVVLGPAANTGSTEADRFIAELDPPFTVWAYSGASWIGAYYLEWPEPGYTSYYPGERLNAVHLKTPEVPPYSCRDAVGEEGS